jgi:RNA polymerase-binding transcription factor DksA
MIERRNVAAAESDMNRTSDDRNEQVRLEQQRAELRARLDAIRDDLRQPLEADSEERAIQLENREVLEGIARAASEELARIEQRLARLKTGR